LESTVGDIFYYERRGAEALSIGKRKRLPMDNSTSLQFPSKEFVKSLDSMFKCQVSVISCFLCAFAPLRS